MKLCKKLFLFLLSVVLLTGIFSVMASAQTETATETTTESLDIPFQVNPLYADVIDASQVEIDLSSVPALLDNPEYVSFEEAVDAVRAYMKARTETFTVYVFTSDADAKNTMWSDIINAAKQHTGDPCEGDYLLWQYGGAGGKISIRSNSKGYYLGLTYQVTYYTTAAQEAEVDAAVDALLAELALDGKSDYEKICGIYDYMTSNIQYDYDGLADSGNMLIYTAYDAIINKAAVCQGYANLFYLLALELGVDTRIIAGDAYNGLKTGGHAWNIVALSDQYYCVDSTWDAVFAQAGQDYEYFLKGTDTFSSDHFADTYYSYPVSTADYEPPVALGSGSCGDGLTWKLTEDGVLTISGTGAMPDYTSNNAPWQSYLNNITSVVVENGVTSIGNYAFYKCNHLVCASLPDSVTSIGDGAFEYCSALTSVTIPAGVKTISPDAFQFCSSITGYWVDEDNSYYANDAYGVLYNAGMTELVLCPSCYSGAYTIADTVTSIGKWAFYGCSALTDVQIPAGVTTIGWGAFAETSLESITFPSTLTSLGSYALADSALTQIVFEGDAPEFADEVFSGLCAAIYYPDGNDTWTDDVMQDHGGTITWTAYSKAVAEVNGTAYTSVFEALAAAKSGDTVALTDDTEEAYILVKPGVALDLAGNTLTVTYVSAFNGSDVIDSVGGGLLAVDKSTITLSADNAQIPVWTGNGYIFTDAAFNQRIKETAAEYFVFQFKPTVSDSSVKTYLQSNLADSGLSVVVHLTWSSNGNTTSMDFTYNTETAQQVFSQGTLTLTVSGITGLEDMTVTAMIVSDSNVVASGETLTLA